MLFYKSKCSFKSCIQLKQSNTTTMYSLLNFNQPNMLQQFNILIQVDGFSIISTNLFITSQIFLTIKHEGKEPNKKDQTKMYTNLAKSFLFY